VDNIHNTNTGQSTDEWLSEYTSQPARANPLNTKPATAQKITADDSNEGVVIEHALIPPGEYKARYMRHEAKANFKGYGDKLVVEFCISDGEHSGEVTRCFYNIQIQEKGWQTKGGSRWVKELRTLFPEKKRKDRLPPLLLKNRNILIEVVTVTQGSGKRELDLSAYYSKVSKLIRIIE
jgi:hypothetical protein